jgi:hypothetical protein
VFKIPQMFLSPEQCTLKTCIFSHFFHSRSIVLDYDITINRLRDEDRIFVGGALGNYSLAGFEMILRRHVSHYIINYYLPSGLFVVVSWISFLVPSDIIPGKIKSSVLPFSVESRRVASRHVASSRVESRRVASSNNQNSWISLLVPSDIIPGKKLEVSHKKNLKAPCW